MALCGACTVHLDGAPVRSCQTPLSAVSGKKVVTIESMASNPVGKKLQAAWIAHDVPQCGYCQSGQIMSAAALLAAKPNPTDARHRPGDGRQHLPLRNLPAHPRRDPHRREGSLSMSAVLQDRSRRHFLKTTVAVSGGLMGSGLIVGCASMSSMSTPKNLPPSAFAPGAMPNAWVKISPDNQVTIINARVEMGQGAFTSMPTLVAEELDVPITMIRVEMAPAKEPYINTMLGGQITGGSTSVREAYDTLRVAGAQARAMLMMAAAQNGGGSMRASLRTENAFVHRAGGPEGDVRRAGRSRLEAAAAQVAEAEGAERVQGRSASR